MKIELEICIDSVESALAAHQEGADRIELCSNLVEGGCTPSWGMIKECRQIPDLELYVMIRPRGGDFCYSDNEFKVMCHDIEMAKELGADGVVFGLLHAQGSIDTTRTRQLVELASPLKVTFHRAFDMCIDPIQAIDDLKGCGIYRLLTSGQEQTAYEGRHLIEELVNRTHGSFQIMAGSGVNEQNVKELILSTGIRACHLSAKKEYPGNMEYRNSRINMGGVSGLSEYNLYQSSKEKIEIIRNIINNI